MPRYRFEPESRLEGFSDDARAAMEASPDYFVWWYSAKSLLLVGVACALAYQLGKGSRGRPSRRRRR
jgi:hypothetical protein